MRIAKLEIRYCIVNFLHELKLQFLGGRDVWKNAEKLPKLYFVF